MTNQAVKNKLFFILFSAVAFAISMAIQLNAIVPTLMIALAAYLSVRKESLKHCSFLNLTLLYLVSFAAGFFIIRQGLPVYYIPFAGRGAEVSGLRSHVGIMLFHAVRAEAVGEGGIRSLHDILLNLLPVTAVVPHLLAARADRQEPRSAGLRATAPREVVFIGLQLAVFYGSLSGKSQTPCHLIFELKLLIYS